MDRRPEIPPDSLVGLQYRVRLATLGREMAGLMRGGQGGFSVKRWFILPVLSSSREMALMQRFLVFAVIFLISSGLVPPALAEQVLEYGVVEVRTLPKARSWQYWVIRRVSSPDIDVNFEYRFVDEFNNEFFATPGRRARDGFHFTLEQWAHTNRIEGTLKATVAELTVRPILNQPYSGYVTIQGWHDYEGIFHPLNVSRFGSRPRGTEMVFYPR